MTAGQDCGACRFSDIESNEDGPVLECHRFPPQLIGGTTDEVLLAWPQVKGGDWCGEWIPKAPDGG